MATLIDSRRTTEFRQVQEEVPTSDENVKRRWVKTKRLKCQFSAASADDVFETQQFSTPSGYTLREIISRTEEPSHNYGVHEEIYEKLEAYTTTTTTTTTT